MQVSKVCKEKIEKQEKKMDMAPFLVQKPLFVLKENELFLLFPLLFLLHLSTSILLQFLKREKEEKEEMNRKKYGDREQEISSSLQPILLACT